MANGDTSEQAPATKPGENEERVQDSIEKLREAGLVARDTTTQGGGIGIVVGVRKPKQ